MPTYQIPRSDVGRLSFLSKTMQTAAIDTAKGITYVDATLLADITAHYNAYHAAYTAVEAALSKRVGETAESVAAIETLKLFIRHIWTSIGNRAQRQQLSAGVFNYYQLNADGSRPTMDDTREAWIQLGKQIVAGDAQAVLAGFAAVAEPSALELQAVLDTAISEADDVVSADRDYDIAQANLDAFRAAADEMVADVRGN